MFCAARLKIKLIRAGVYSIFTCTYGPRRKDNEGDVDNEREGIWSFTRIGTSDALIRKRNQWQRWPIQKGCWRQGLSTGDGGIHGERDETKIVDAVCGGPASETESFRRLI
jgi:hypothetical protein